MREETGESDFLFKGYESRQGDIHSLDQTSISMKERDFHSLTPSSLLPFLLLHLST